MHKLIIIFSSFVGSSLCQTQYMKHMLDDMSKFYGSPNSTFDDIYFQKLTKCLVSDGDQPFLDSQNMAWKGMHDYYQSNGTDHDFMNKTDHWGGCTEASADVRCTIPPYLRRTPADFGSDKNDVLIEEPCNYVSNIAFFHSATRICDYPNWSISSDEIKAQKRSFAALGIGSAFWHGSHTFAGSAFDNQMMAVIAYFAHKTNVKHLPNNSTVFQQLSKLPRNSSDLEISEQLENMFESQPVSEWSQTLETLDVPGDYYLTFAAILSTIGSLILPWEIVATVMSALAFKIIPKKDTADFFVFDFLPDLKLATANVELDLDAKYDIASKFTGMLMKIMYAFVWQEHMIPLPKLYQHQFAIKLGGWFLPHWNSLSSKISGFPQTDADVNAAKNVYPGDSYCQGYSPHAIWHEESASGLLEIVFLADSVNAILEKQ